MAPLFELTNIAMVYTLGVVVVALRLGKGPSFLTTTLGVLFFDYLYVPPKFSLFTAELKYLVMFAVMLATGLVVGSLADRLRAEVAATLQLAAEVEIERQRSVLLSSVSHDFRTPLATITAASTALLDAATPLDARATDQLLQAILQESSRAERMVSNLLQMTHFDAGKVEPVLIACHIEEIVGDAAGRFPEALQSGRIFLNLSEGLPECMLDRALTELVVVNLVENALKYSKVEDRVEIRAHYEATRIRVEVLDRGDGIAVSDHARAFEKFERLPNAHGKRGVGLGLAICQAAMRVQRSCINVTARRGGGTTFFFDISLL